MRSITLFTKSATKNKNKYSGVYVERKECLEHLKATYEWYRDNTKSINEHRLRCAQINEIDDKLKMYNS